MKERTFGSGWARVTAIVDVETDEIGCEMDCPTLGLNESEALAQNLLDATKWIREEIATQKGGRNE